MQKSLNIAQMPHYCKTLVSGSTGLNVLSLFDGMSCGRIALERAGIKVNQYFASEIDKYAIQVAKHNYPNIKHIGDVNKVKTRELPKIDLLIGGSPCQSFSRAGDNTGFNGKSGLFWEYVRILKEVKPTYFLLENVKMKKEWQNIISEALGVQPIEICSSLVSAQERKRLYWTNINNITQPKDLDIQFTDVITYGVDEKYYLSDKAIEYMSRKIKNGKDHWQLHPPAPTKNNKSRTIVANYKAGIPYNVIIEPVTNEIRKLTPDECEILQTIPEGYSNIVSNTQRYKMIGNGWTVDIIAHILSFAEWS
jgi:DNA-cytosine methyltransferase